MNKQQVELAVGAGLELLGEKSEVIIPVRLNDGAFFLKQLLMLIASGQMGLQPTVQTDPAVLPGDVPPVATPPQPTAPSQKKRRNGPPKPRPKPKKRKKV